MDNAQTTMPEERLRQLLAEAPNVAAATILGINPQIVRGYRDTRHILPPFQDRPQDWRRALSRVAQARWRGWQDGNYPEPISSDDLARLVWQELGQTPPAKPAAKAITPGMLLVEVRRYPLDPTHQGRWPTITDLAQHLGRPVEDIQPPADILLDRRLAAMDGDRIMPYEARPGEVVTRQMTEAERAKYGPPSPRQVKPSRPEEPDDRPEPIAPEPADETPQEVQEEMPKGKPINWPPDAELVAMFDAIRLRGGNVSAELCETFQCANPALWTRVGDARVRQGLTRTIRGSAIIVPATADSLSTLPAAPAQGVGTPEPTEAQGEATGGTVPNPEYAPMKPLTAADEGTANAGPDWARRLPGAPPPSDPDAIERARRNLRDSDPASDLKAFAAAMERAAIDFARLATHATLVLLDESADYPAQVRVVHEHMTRAPEQAGDEWPEVTRVDGRQVVRTWTCVGRIEVGGAPTCILLPLGAEVVCGMGKPWKGVA